jgi:hypothetical protein
MRFDSVVVVGVDDVVETYASQGGAAVAGDEGGAIRERCHG